jgi:hypothetical protein
VSKRLVVDQERDATGQLVSLATKIWRSDLTKIVLGGTQSGEMQDIDAPVSSRAMYW